MTDNVDIDVAPSIEAVFDETRDRLLGTAIWLTGDRAVAEEVVQDAFADLVEHWARLRDKNAAPAWLHRAVINRSRSKMRRRAIGRRLGRRADTTPGFGDEVEVDFGDTVAARGPLADAVQALPQRQRECVVLRFYADLSVPQIAAALDLRDGTVKTHLHRGIAKLRDTLDPEDWQS